MLCRWNLASMPPSPTRLPAGGAPYRRAATTGAGPHRARRRRGSNKTCVILPAPGSALRAVRVQAPAGNPVRRFTTRRVSHRIDTEYWMPAFAGMTAEGLRKDLRCRLRTHAVQLRVQQLQRDGEIG